MKAAALRWLVVAAVAVLVVFVPRAVAASWVVEAAAVPAEPNGGLQGVSCPATRWCAAVGSFTDRASRVRPLFEIFSGRHWRFARTTDSPDLTSQPGTASGSFGAVSCVSSVACVAVGRNGYDGGFQVLPRNGTAVRGQLCGRRRRARTALCHVCHGASVLRSGTGQGVGTACDGKRSRLPIPTEAA